MVLSPPTTDNFYKFCSTFGLIIMIGPATAVTILTVYTTDMFEKVELVTAALQVDMGHKKPLGKVIENNPSGSTLIEEREKLSSERGNSITLKKELTKQNLTLEKAKRGLWFLTIAIFPTAILYSVGATLAFFGYKKRYKTQLAKDKKP